MFNSKDKLVSIVVSLIWVTGLTMTIAYTAGANDSVLDQTTQFDQFHYAYYSGTWKRLPNFSQLTPVHTGYSSAINLDDRPKDSYFGAVFVGQLKIDIAGDYTFYITSDDGSKLIIDGRPMIDNDDTHASKTEQGTVFLSAGYHQIRVEFFQRKGGKKLAVYYQGADTNNNKQTLDSPTLALKASPPQFHYAYYSGKWKRLPNFSKLIPVDTGYSATINLDDRPKGSYFGAVFVSQLKIETAGDYRFYATSDDGSKLIIDGQPVVDNDGTHASKTKSGTQYLSTGYHQIRVEFFQRKDGKKLEIHYQGADTDQRKQTLRPSTICFCADASQIEYQYDELSRLTSVLVPESDLKISYVYDAMGNRLAQHSGTISDQTLKNHSFSVVQPTDLPAASFDDLTLSWVHQVPEGGHFYYEVYFGETNSPDLYKSGLTEQSLHIGAVESSLRQFLQIKAIDTRGNEATSPIWILSPLDTDSDGIPDHIENTICVDAQNADSDNDGLSDGLEDQPIFGIITPQETDPCNPDSDGDRMPDGWEVQNGLNPLDAEDANSDTDEDGLSHLQEFQTGTAPDNPDSDGDQMPDGWEVQNGLNPLDAEDATSDADGDGLSHLQEFQTGTAPDNPDSDGDQMPDGWEVQNGLNPLDAEDANSDTDEDGLSHLQEFQTGTAPDNPDSDGDQMPDGWEVQNGLNPLDAEDTSSDTDSDGLTHLQEFQAGTEPNNPDSDGDHMPDGWEVQNGLNPLDAEDASSDIDSDADGINDPWEWRYFGNLDADPSLDTDSDGLTHLQEFQAGTEPDKPDSDGDRMPDGWEVQNGLNPLDAEDANSHTDEDGFSALEEYRSETDPNDAESIPPGVLIDFNGTDLPESLQWINEGNQSWALDTFKPLEGRQSLKSGTIAHNQSSRIKVLVISAGGLVRFNLRVSSESCCDYLSFFLDDQLLQRWSGTVETTVSFELPAGYHVLEWRYHKDHSVNRGNDAAWIDQLFISAQENVDSDTDGIDDLWEWGYFGDLNADLSFDTDSDGLTHLQEFQAGTEPNNPDSDGDQMPDGWEVQNGLNPLDTEDASSDIDSDADGIDDPWEWKYFGNLDAGPSFDTDSDGLTHLQEFQAGTAPDNPDFDGDLMPDGWEVDNGLNPLNSTDANGDINDNGQSNFVEYALSIPTQSINMDSDKDRLPDLWEARYGLNPLDASDAGSDEDEDGFSALEEYVSGDDPNEFDSAPIGIEFDFEGEVLPESLSWIHEGSGSWELDQSDPLEGEQSLKSSGILENDYSNPFNQSRVIKTHLVSSGGIVRFDLKVAPGSFNDTLQFYLDDQLLEEWARNAWSGVPQTTAVFYLPAGVHELKWLYYKPYSGGDRSYAFWLDRLFISLEEDSDADGVMDSWELRYFGHLDEDLSQDSDGDGLTHLQEVESGTDPN